MRAAADLRLRRGAAAHGAPFRRLAGRGARHRLRRSTAAISRPAMTPARRQRALDARGDVGAARRLLPRRDGTARRWCRTRARRWRAIAERADIVVLTNLQRPLPRSRGSSSSPRSASRTASNATRAARASRSRGWSPNMAIRSRCSSTICRSITNRSREHAPRRPPAAHGRPSPSSRPACPPRPHAHARIDDWREARDVDRGALRRRRDRDRRERCRGANPHDRPRSTARSTSWA